MSGVGSVVSVVGNIAMAPVRAASSLFTPREETKVWTCGCGEVELHMQGEPLFSFDCHCSACTPIAKYLAAKSEKSISAVVNETGVAKAFYTLDKVTIVKGKDKMAGVKLGAAGKNVRSYCKPCGTMIVGDSPVPFGFRPFNRCALKNADGTPYVPAEPVWGIKWGGCAWADAVPEPKHEADPEWLVAKIDNLGPITIPADLDGDATPGFFPDPDACTEVCPKPGEKRASLLGRMLGY